MCNSHQCIVPFLGKRCGGGDIYEGASRPRLSNVKSLELHVFYVRTNCSNYFTPYVQYELV